MLLPFDGEFFSSSSSGFCDGLGLLLISRAKERPMRVSPWNRYHLVGPEVEQGIHGRLDSKKRHLLRKRTLFICFRCASSAPEVPGQRSSETEDGNCEMKLKLKSNLKRQAGFLALTEGGKIEADCVDQRRVHWRDASGSELAEVKEFDAGYLFEFFFFFFALLLIMWLKSAVKESRRMKNTDRTACVDACA